MKERPQDVAAKRLAHARRQIAEAAKRIRRASTSLRLWERRAAYYAQRASRTDAELGAERELRKAKAADREAQRRRRGIVLSRKESA